MTNTVLVHGYAVGLRASLFRKPLPNHAGFSGLDAEVQSGDVAVFRWCKDVSLSMTQSMNPLEYLQLYFDEEALAESPVTHSALYEFIDRSNATTVICHSLGSRLMIGTLNAHGIPESISKIVLLQGDVPTSASITNRTIQNRLADESLEIENYFCPWDQSLIASAMLHRTNRIGLFGWNKPGITDVFYPLLKPLNLHTSPMRDREFLRELITK